MTGPTKPQRRPSILVVEDEEDVRRMLGLGLAAVGDVTLAIDGLDAYERLAGGLVPDVIVTDLMMPRLDGLALLERLKTERIVPGVPVVILSARSRAPDVVTGINAGARHYVTKPFEMANLVSKVRKALGNKAL